jgi:hypothetical protein
MTTTREPGRAEVAQLMCRVGIRSTPEKFLAQARRKVPEATFEDLHAALLVELMFNPPRRSSSPSRTSRTRA